VLELNDLNRVCIEILRGAGVQRRYAGTQLGPLSARQPFEHEIDVLEHGVLLISGERGGLLQPTEDPAAGQFAHCFRALEAQQFVDCDVKRQGEAECNLGR
jgi:hypothetical protein